MPMPIITWFASHAVSIKQLLLLGVPKIFINCRH